MSLTNDQITAKNFKEFYEAIRPYLNGSFPTTIANKFDKANMYSTDEQIVGRWIDGKPIYQKTVALSQAVDIPQSTWYDIPILTNNIDNVTNCFVISTVDRVYYSAMATAAHGNTYVKIRHYRADQAMNCTHITLQYTKTSDSAIAIGSDTDYSETEKIVGTWIDGKPLYQKTYSITGTYSGTMDNVISLSSNIDEFAHIEIFGTDETGTYLPIPYVNNLSSAQASGYFISKSDGVYKVSLRFAAAAQISFNKLVFHVQYTKTTD